MAGSMQTVPNGDTSFDMDLKDMDRTSSAIERRIADTKIRFALGKISVEAYHQEMDTLDIEWRRALGLVELRGRHAGADLIRPRT
ncbi:MAG: hypothetical protein KY455_01425 [Euryarchaeota archaeon]|nr:hypothetical protein [Euryarchaeota archaeon]